MRDRSVFGESGCHERLHCSTYIIQSSISRAVRHNCLAISLRPDNQLLEKALQPLRAPGWVQVLSDLRDLSHLIIGRIVRVQLCGGEKRGMIEMKLLAAWMYHYPVVRLKVRKMESYCTLFRD
jgi:hypothetical protein